MRPFVVACLDWWGKTGCLWSINTRITPPPPLPSHSAQGYPEWLQLVGLLHGLGRLAFVLFLEASRDFQSEYEDWAFGGQAWVVGCPFPDAIRCVGGIWVTCAFSLCTCLFLCLSFSLCVHLADMCVCLA